MKKLDQYASRNQHTLNMDESKKTAATALENRLEAYQIPLKGKYTRSNISFISQKRLGAFLSH